MSTSSSPISQTSSDASEILFNYFYTPHNTSILWVIIAILLLSVITLIVYVIRVKRQHIIFKMTDEETGIGNLSYFKHNFSTLITDEVREFYHIAYIILDISYLRSYHNYSSFDEALMHTSSILKNNTSKGEFFARISENGFAFALKSNDKNSISDKLDSIMSELN